MDQRTQTGMFGLIKIKEVESAKGANVETILVFLFFLKKFR
jgi:hypothetical protein